MDSQTPIPEKTRAVDVVVEAGSSTSRQENTLEPLTVEDGEAAILKKPTPEKAVHYKIRQVFNFIQSRMLSGTTRRIILGLILLDVILVYIRFNFRQAEQPKLTMVFTFLFVQVTMSLMSIFMFKRIVAAVPRNPPKTVVICFFTLWMILAHSCWMWYDVPIPNDFFLSVLSFLALGAYLHTAIILLVFFCVERIVHYAAPRVTNVLLKSEGLHTIVAIVLALILSLHGFSVTSGKPLVRNVNIHIKDLPQEFDGFSIGLITDIHIGPSVGRARVVEIVQVLNQMQPDLVAISGDLVDGYVSYLKGRAEPLADLRSRYGTFFVTGNHEYIHENVDNWLKYFKDELNITALRNQGVVLDKGGKNICLAGVDDLFTERINFPGHKMDINKALNDCPDKMPTVLLVHQPNGASRALQLITESKKRVDLILSGHTHGGQMAIVWPIGYLYNRFFFGHYYYPETDTQIYVSSGVNYWGPPIKLPNLCEIANVRLHTAAPE